MGLRPTRNGVVAVDGADAGVATSVVGDVVASATRRGIKLVIARG
jgi:hypothetical protein